MNLHVLLDWVFISELIFNLLVLVIYSADIYYNIRFIRYEKTIFNIYKSIRIIVSIVTLIWHVVLTTFMFTSYQIDVFLLGETVIVILIGFALLLSSKGRYYALKYGGIKWFSKT